MFKFKRQRTLKEEFSLEIISAKSTTSADFLTAHILLNALPLNKELQKKFLKENNSLKNNLHQAQKLYSFEGKLSETALGHIDGSTQLFVGLGNLKDFYPKNLLKLGAKTALAIEKIKNHSFALNIDTFFIDSKGAKASELPRDFAQRSFLKKTPALEEALEFILLGMGMALYKIPNPKNLDKPKEALQMKLFSQKISPALLEKTKKQVLEKLEALYWARDICHQAPNLLTPEVFAKEIRQLAEKHHVKTKVLDEKRLKSEGFGGIWSVGKGSENPPRLVQLEYNSANKKLPHLVLVGKGVTFDTGGISLKPPPGMESMKHDMTGAAIATATTAAIAALKLPLRVTTLLPLAENRPGHNSFLPGDVYQAWGGTTVEVQNTDAEGRLLLADCLAYAAALEGDLVIDLATLTGASIVTLGPVGFLLYGNSDTWIEKFKNSTHTAGEECWEMPLFEEFSEDLKSTVAHLRNHVGHRDGNSHIAAAFLNHFVDNKYPWLHLDIASYTSTHKWKGPHCPPEVNPALPLLALYQMAKDMCK